MSWLSNLFGGGKHSNPADAAMPYLNQIPGQTSQYMQPYFQAGQQAIAPLQQQYGNLLNDPGGRMNQIGGSFQQSPGFKFAMEQALASVNHQNAMGGMAGTPAHEFQQMQTATGLANQDYNNWLQHAMGLYNTGLSGEQGLAGMGQQSGQGMADMIAQTLAQQGNMAFRGQQEKNSQNNSLLGGLGRIGGAALGGLAGGPWGAFAGWNASR